MKGTPALKVIALAVAFGSMLPRADAQTPLPGTVWRYTLVEGSQIVDDCPICDRVPIVEPMRGTYDLRLIQQGPLFFYYAIENLCFTNIGTFGRTYKVTGRGLFQIGGEVGVNQSFFLEANVSNGFTNQQCFFTNVSRLLTRLWPMMQEGLNQTNGTWTQFYHLDLNAAPLREIWFSLSQNFTAGIWNAPSNLVSNGDLISALGRVVKRNGELTSALGLMPPVPSDLGLKDIDILPGGEIAFSIEHPIWSETLGPLRQGDLLSDRGQILRTNEALVAAFLPDHPPTNGLGLGAVQLMASGETWFSVQTNFYSKSFHAPVSAGDLLSDAGVIIRSNAQLVAGLAPVNRTNDFGLKAIYVWPSGEIWFTTAAGFDGANAEHYNAGDLLSDQGYLVYRNSELVSAFSPVSVVTNVPVDALYVVTDVLPNSPAPVLSLPLLTNDPPLSLSVQWRGQGRVFQLESATNLPGPFSPVAPITTGTTSIDTGAQTNGTQKFYRVHQW